MTFRDSDTPRKDLAMALALGDPTFSSSAPSPLIQRLPPTPPLSVHSLLPTSPEVDPGLTQVAPVHQALGSTGTTVCDCFVHLWIARA